MAIYSRFDASTGRFLGTRETSSPILTGSFGAGEIVVEGAHTEQHKLDLDTGHVVKMKKAKARLVDPGEVRRFAGRLLGRTDWQIIRQVETGKPVSEDTAAYRSAVRDRLDVILAMDPIPLDYTDERHWPPR